MADPMSEVLGLLAGVSAWIRSALGAWAEPPLAGVTVVLVCSAITLAHFALQRAMMDVEEVAEQYREVSEWRREYLRARMRGDHRALAKLMRKQAYINKLNAEIMAKSLKPTLIYLIPFWVIFIVLWKVFEGPVVYFPLIGRGIEFVYWYIIASGGVVPIFQRLLGLSYASSD